jgi:hypothetical protein
MPMKCELLEECQKLFYQAELKPLVKMTKGMDVKDWSFKEKSRLIVLLSDAYCELNQEDKAIESLDLFLSENGAEKDTDFYQYVKGKLFQISGNDGIAGKYFANVLERVSDRELLFKTLVQMRSLKLGLESSEVSKFDQVNALFTYLDNSLLESREDLEIELELLKGNIKLLAQSAPLSEVKDHFSKSLSIAAKNNWFYYMAKSLLGITKTYWKFRQYSKAESSLFILNSMIKSYDLKRIKKYIKNELKFGRKKYDGELIEFDSTSFSFRVKEQQIDLSQRPKVFSFLKASYTPSKFVSKREMAKVLWPGEMYSKTSGHDARIFDIAKRARGIVNSFPDELMFFSGRLGYRLAIKDEPVKQKNLS